MAACLGRAAGWKPSVPAHIRSLVKPARDRWRLVAYRSTPKLPFDYSECFLKSVAIKPRYPVKLVLAALRAYSTLPMSKDGSIVGLFYFDREKQPTSWVEGKQKFVQLPNDRFGKPRRLAVIADTAVADKLAERKVDVHVIRPNTLNDYFTKVKDKEQRLHHYYLATTSMQADLRPHARLLKELTPTAKKKLVFDDVDALCQRIDELLYRRRYAISPNYPARVAVGSVLMSDDHILENMKHFAHEVRKHISSSQKFPPTLHRVILSTQFGRFYQLDADSISLLLK